MQAGRFKATCGKQFVSRAAYDKHVARDKKICFGCWPEELQKAKAQVQIAVCKLYNCVPFVIVVAWYSVQSVLCAIMQSVSCKLQSVFFAGCSLCYAVCVLCCYELS